MQEPSALKTFNQVILPYCHTREGRYPPHSSYSSRSPEATAFREHPLPIRLCEKGFSRTKQSHKNPSITLANVERAKRTSPRRTGESRYPVLILKVILPYKICLIR